VGSGHQSRLAVASPLESPGTGPERSHLTKASAAPEFETLEWLEDGKHQLDWNGPTARTFVRFRQEDLDRSVIYHFELVARRYSDRIAIADSNSLLSFAQLWSGLSGLAESITAQTQQGELIGILLPACPMFPLAMLACLAAGRPFVALDTHYPGEWLDQVLQDARPSLLIASAQSLETLKTAPPTTTCIIHLNRLPEPARSGWRPVELGLDEPACVLFTSGSTGRPKGIVNSQRNLLQRVAQSINAGHINAEDKFLTLAPLCTIVGVRDITTALLAGASIQLLDAQRSGARDILGVLHSQAITILFAFPALLRSIVAYDRKRAGDALRLVRVGGDTTLWSDIELLRAWLAPDAAIQLIYAATEAPIMQWFIDDSFRGNDLRIPIGYPLAGTRLAVIDDLGRATPPGEVGELMVESPYVALGLWVDGRCITDGFENTGTLPSHRRFRTGDLVRQRPDGLLERLGRKDRQIKIRGMRVELESVEAILRQDPFVLDVGALARTSSDGDVMLVAYVSARDDAPDDLLEELKTRMRSVAPLLRPGRLYLTDEIPRLPSSKLNVRALITLDQANRDREQQALLATAGAAADGDCIVRTVAQTWQKVLLAPADGPEQDFFAAGGDSLKAIAFMMELERSLGQELPLSLISETQTFSGLCAALQEQRTTQYVPVVLLKTGEGPPPVFFIHGLGGNVAELFPIARSMAYPGPVFGIQARGLAPRDVPHTTVEAMAIEYLGEIKARQPRGPYYLCGYSFGGLVAFEMARRLSASGDAIGLLGLFDTMPSSLSWPLDVWLAVIRRRLVRFARTAIGVPIWAWPAAGWQAGNRAYVRLRDHLTQRQPDDPPLPRFLKAAPSSILKVAAGALVASARYRPGFYPGALKLFIPTERDATRPAPGDVWRKYVRTLSIVNTAGGHLTMLSTSNAESTAASLTHCLPVW
jgi:non-ribosomal peptide synthetase component F/thioesterase domain-containing protein/acyl carrier protein